MQIPGSTALVTGANRGLGREFVRALLDRGIGTVHAAARDDAAVRAAFPDDDRVVPLALDITDEDAVAAAAQRCDDTSLVINNAGAMMLSPFIGAPDLSAARAEMETNYFGTLSMARAFAPVLAAHGGGALVDVLSVVSWYALPFNASYCASKSAEWALTNALRVELRGQGTLVVAVHPGFIDTDMTATVDAPKITPRDVAAQTLDAVEHGREEVVTDEWSRGVRDSLPHHLESLYPQVQQQWDRGANPWGTTSS